MSKKPTSFGPFIFDPETGTLLRGSVPVALGYRAFLLLEALLQRPGEVRTKTELFEAGWPGAIVEETNLSVQIAALRKALGIAANGRDWIVTVPRVGYRFQGEVDPVVTARSGGERDEVLGQAGPSIAVLPFANLSPDPDQDYFAEGVVEDIIAGLSRLRWLAVVAKNSSFVYKGKTVDIRTIAAELGVRYALEGGVRRAGDRLRVTGRLVDGATGKQMWAEQYDGSVGDVFAVQEEIARGVVAAIEPQLYAAEETFIRQRPPGNIDAWGFTIRAMAQIWSWDEAQNAVARENLRQALALDPAYARAHSLLALALMTGAHMGWLSPAEALPLARVAARRSVAADGGTIPGGISRSVMFTSSRARPRAPSTNCARRSGSTRASPSAIFYWVCRMAMRETG